MKRVLCPFLVSVMLAPSAFGQESFRVELGRDGETIADMRPVFLKFENRPLPAISPVEVARRYQQLFHSSNEPEVRIDALNRLSNIRDRSGQDIGFSPEQEARIYEEVLGSYESILARGSYSGRLDELLYQMAKAHALTGQSAESVARLRQLVGLYPDSSLAPEARFRIAEAAFSDQRYGEAESGYRAVLEDDNAGALRPKARYMLGWSQFKQGPAAWDKAAATFLSALDEFLPTEASVRQIPDSSIETVDDTLRILAVMAARDGGLQTLADWLGSSQVRPWQPLVYDRLADLYATQGQFQASAEVNRAFVERYPGHRLEPAFRAQLVQVWQQSGDTQAHLRAKADFVTAYRELAQYQTLAPNYQRQWQGFSRELADRLYNQATTLSEQGIFDQSQLAFAKSATYYERLAARTDDPGPVWRLAADAALQAGDASRALTSYRTAGYDVVGYAEGADAAWAAITLLRDRVAADPEGATDSHTAALMGLSAEVDRFSGRYPSDPRASGVQLDLAAQWFASGDPNRALAYAKQVLNVADRKPSEQYGAWVIIAEIRQAQREHGLAERAWRQALTLAERAVPAAEFSATRSQLQHQLAQAVYQQGEQAAEQGKVATAVAHFQRVETVLPGSEVAIRARYDAANTLLKAGDFQSAINELQRFRRDYGDHELSQGVSEKLVFAYTESGQPERAAAELLAVADTLAGSADPWPFRLRAAELLHVSGKEVQRNRVYEDYLATAPVPTTGPEHHQLQAMRWRLAAADNPRSDWHRELVNAELSSQWHSEQSLQWAAASALVLGAEAAHRFAAIELTFPLEQSLERKQAAMDEARERLAQAERFGGEAVRSEVLYRRAELYRELAQALMASPVPSELNELEAAQYQMLLEEEAYPFEEQALELHAENHRRIASQGYDAWIGKSLTVLGTLNPGRYQRPVRWMSWNEESKDDAG